jgi:hypothetical protein
MLVKIYLPVEPVEQSKVLEELVKKYKSVTLSVDDAGKPVAEISENKQLEIHPNTGLPILLD